MVDRTTDPGVWDVPPYDPMGGDIAAWFEEFAVLSFPEGLPPAKRKVVEFAFHSGMLRMLAHIYWLGDPEQEDVDPADDLAAIRERLGAFGLAYIREEGTR